MSIPVFMLSVFSLEIICWLHSDSLQKCFPYITCGGKSTYECSFQNLDCAIKLYAPYNPERARPALEPLIK